MGELVFVSWSVLHALACPSTCTHVHYMAGSAHPGHRGKVPPTILACRQPLRSPNYLALSALIKLPSHYNVAFRVDIPTRREQADL